MIISYISNNYGLSVCTRDNPLTLSICTGDNPQALASGLSPVQADKPPPVRKIIHSLCPPVREIIHEQKLVDYLPYMRINHGILFYTTLASVDLAMCEIFRAKVCDVW